MRRVRITKNPETEDLDLAPMLAMIVSLIPILLMSFTFYHTAVVDAKVPAPAAKATSKKKDEVKYKVYLQLNDDRQVMFLVKQKEKVVSKVTVTSKAGQFDLGKITSEARILRKKWSEVAKLQMIPSDGVSYDEIIQVIDKVKDQKKTSELYDEVIFSNIFKG